MGLMLFKWDRGNLYKALQRGLDNEGDFYQLYHVFNGFYFQKPLYHEAIAFMEGVVKKLDRFSKKENEFLSQYASVIGNLGTNYHQIKDFSKAKKNHKKALELLQQAGKRQQTATGYHQLGWVAEEERDFAEAKRNYREALKIKQEFNDRFSQASTYGQMGIMAEAEKDYASSLGYYATALEIFHEYNDQYNLEKTIRNLAVLLQIKDWDAPGAIAQLEIKEETKKALQPLLEKVKKEK